MISFVPLYSTSGDNDGVLWVMGVEFGRAQLILGQAVKESNRCQHITVTGHANIRFAKLLPEQAAQRGGRQRPIPAWSPLSPVDGADTWNSDKEHAAGFEHSMQCRYSLAHIINQMKRLRQHDTIKRLRGKIIALGEIANQGCARITRADVQDIAMRHSSSAVLHGISIVTDLENPPSDVFRVAGQEIFDVATVHRLAAIVAEVWADWAQSPQVAEPDGFAPNSR